MRISILADNRAVAPKRFRTEHGLAVLLQTAGRQILLDTGVVRLFTLKGETHLLALTLDQAEKELDPQRFMRVNRQFIVNAAAVEKLSNWFLGKMRVHLKGYPLVDIIVSKEKATSVKKWLDS